MGLKWTTLIGVGLALLVGILFGHNLFGPALGFLKPEGLEAFYLVQADAFMKIQVGFVFLFGGLFCLPPLLVEFVRRRGFVRYLSVFLFYFTGFTASVLAAFYMKIQILRAAGQYEALGQTPRMPVPPMFLIPMVGIAALLATFLVLRLVFRPRPAATAAEPIKDKAVIGRD